MKTHHYTGELSLSRKWSSIGLHMSKNTRRITIPGCGGNETLLIDMLSREGIPSTSEESTIVYINNKTDVATFKPIGYQNESSNIMTLHAQDDKAKLPERQWFSIIIEVSALRTLKSLLDDKMIKDQAIH